MDALTVADLAKQHAIVSSLFTLKHNRDGAFTG